MTGLDDLHHVGRAGAYCGISRGVLDWSGFNPSELAANIAMRERADPDAPLHPNQCGPCDDCRQAMHDWGHLYQRRRVRAESRKLSIAEVEVAQARAPKGKPTARRQRRTNAELRTQVLDLRERGIVPAAIADALNISDRRCNVLLRQATAGNGVANPHHRRADRAAKAVTR